MAPITNFYLAGYNALSAILWLVVLTRTVTIVYSYGPAVVGVTMDTWVRWTQTLAALEIVHSLVGLVRTPIITTAMQVASRFLLVWGVVYPCPDAATWWPYCTMLFAWSVTEVIRYSYFCLHLTSGVPEALTRLRYSTFYVLYPVGILSELTVIHAAAMGAGQTRVAWWYPWFLAVAGLTYLPGAPTLYNHMRKQRRKVMSGPRKTL